MRIAWSPSRAADDLIDLGLPGHDGSVQPTNPARAEQRDLHSSHISRRGSAR
jgi:hypothetical protein